MEMQIDPRRLSFGALSAERDIAEGLADYFVESDAFKRLREGVKTVALGNRGAGKSAIFKVLAESEKKRGTHVIELAPEDYSYELLSSTMTRELDGAWQKQGAYTAAWKFLIYVQVMKEITSSGRGFKAGPKARIYAYLRDNHADQDLNPIATLISFLKRLEGVKLGSIEAGLKARELQRLYKLQEIEPLLPDLFQVCSQEPVIVLIDELDKGWDASEDAQAFVAGLFQATQSINAQSQGIRVLMSLRKELYESIPSLFEDAQKIRDSFEVIEWDEPELLELISRRITHSIPSTRELSSEQIWNLVFSETLDFRQTKSFNYLIDRTLYRPRELIQFCKDILEKVIDRGEQLPANYGVISQAELAYSEARLKDIAAEYRFQYPGLESVFETFRGGPHTMDRSTLELHCLAIGIGGTRVDPVARGWTTDIEPDDLIGVLWQVGFMRAQAVGGLKARRRSGSSYLGSHQISSLSLHNLERFHVHPMFRDCLGLKEPKRKKSQSTSSSSRK